MDTLFTVESLLLGIIQVKDIGDLQGLKVAYLPKEADSCLPAPMLLMPSPYHLADGCYGGQGHLLTFPSVSQA